MSPGLGRRFAGLEAARARTLALLDGRDRVALDRPPGPGRWSALQVLHHVVEAEAATLGYIRKKMQAGSSLPAVGLAARVRGAALRLSLALPLRFRAPAVAASVPESVDPEALRARWEEVRRGWRDLLEGFPPEFEGRLVFRHPVAGRLSLSDALAVQQAHLEHHLRQVRRALASPSGS
jgi:hypothetical protein